MKGLLALVVLAATACTGFASVTVSALTVHGADARTLAAGCCIGVVSWAVEYPKDPCRQPFREFAAQSRFQQ